jgi:hypothetical protein
MGRSANGVKGDCCNRGAGAVVRCSLFAGWIGGPPFNPPLPEATRQHEVARCCLGGRRRQREAARHRLRRGPIP